MGGGLLDLRESAAILHGSRGALLPINATSTAYAASLRVKSGPTKLFGFTVYNSGAAQFVLLFDAATLPADGVPPVSIFAVAATTTLPIYFGQTGRTFNAGCFICNSSTGPTKTIGAADCFFDAQYL